jgi:hypothetical protein
VLRTETAEEKLQVAATTLGLLDVPDSLGIPAGAEARLVGTPQGTPTAASAQSLASNTRSPAGRAHPIPQRRRGRIGKRTPIKPHEKHRCDPAG